jgi:hypothetical protein
MNKTRLAEALDLRGLMPEEVDFKLITEAYLDCYINGTHAAIEHTPDGLAYEAEFVEGDLGAPLKFMIVAAMLG